VAEEGYNARKFAELVRENKSLLDAMKTGVPRRYIPSAGKTHIPIVVYFCSA
jgi:hypothetical protein